MRHAMLALAVLLLDAGCIYYGCTDVLIWSVDVHVFDAAGDPYAPEDVTYAIDGGAERPCEPGYGVEPAHRFACGADEDGDFVIRVYDGGAVAAEEHVHIGRTVDRCHVEPQRLEFVL